MHARPLRQLGPFIVGVLFLVGLGFALYALVGRKWDALRLGAPIALDDGGAILPELGYELDRQQRDRELYLRRVDAHGEVMWSTSLDDVFLVDTTANPRLILAASDLGDKAPRLDAVSIGDGALVWSRATDPGVLQAVTEGAHLWLWRGFEAERRSTETGDVLWHDAGLWDGMIVSETRLFSRDGVTRTSLSGAKLPAGRYGTGMPCPVGDSVWIARTSHHIGPLRLLQLHADGTESPLDVPLPRT